VINLTNFEREKTYHTGQNVIINRNLDPFNPQWVNGTIINDSPEETCVQKFADLALLKKSLVVGIGDQEITISQTPSRIRPRFDSE
jgi:hypothetical protein